MDAQSDAAFPVFVEQPPPRSHARLIISIVGLALYAGVVLLATMWPTPLDRGYSESIDRVLEVLHRNGVPTWFGYSKFEFTANIAMFFPLGFLLSLALPRRVWWVALVLLPLFSGTIELLQATFLAERFASVFDVIANTLGGYLGSAVALVVRAIVRARDETVLARALWEAGVRRYPAP
ncbi:VanZ family protein [Microbacterium sp. NPDC076895]|uniref:VanZ family protein n=1 Tax=Microbacterium sp. NPDC076895 TaxID=3154957 RepID=UPI0034312A48